MNDRLVRCISKCPHRMECEYGQRDERTQKLLPDQNDRYKYGARTIRPVACVCERWKEGKP